MIHIYCGEGKGKTTASVGLCIRAAGRKIPVVFAQFLKNDTSGEIGILKAVPGITVMHTPDQFGFTRTMTQEDRDRAKQEYEALFQRACEAAIQVAGTDVAEHNKCGGSRNNAETDTEGSQEAGKEAGKSGVGALLVLDEAAAVCGSGLLTASSVTEFLRNRPDTVEVVLTGRNPDPDWVELADYVSEVVKRKHPFDGGVMARKGIEF